MEAWGTAGSSLPYITTPAQVHTGAQQKRTRPRPPMAPLRTPGTQLFCARNIAQSLGGKMRAATFLLPPLGKEGLVAGEEGGR